MVRCAIGVTHRSVATARRQFFDLTGMMPEESSFYDRLTPAFADLAWQMFCIRCIDRTWRHDVTATTMGG